MSQCILNEQVEKAFTNYYENNIYATFHGGEPEIYNKFDKTHQLLKSMGVRSMIRSKNNFYATVPNSFIVAVASREKCSMIQFGNEENFVENFQRPINYFTGLIGKSLKIYTPGSKILNTSHQVSVEDMRWAGIYHVNSLNPMENLTFRFLDNINEVSRGLKEFSMQQFLNFVDKENKRNGNRNLFVLFFVFCSDSRMGERFFEARMEPRMLKYLELEQNMINNVYDLGRKCKNFYKETGGITERTDTVGRIDFFPKYREEKKIGPGQFLVDESTYQDMQFDQPLIFDEDNKSVMVGIMSPKNFLYGGYGQPVSSNTRSKRAERWQQRRSRRSSKRRRRRSKRRRSKRRKKRN